MVRSVMTIEYTESFPAGRHTCVSYTDKDGTPVASRFAGWWQPDQIERHLEYCRKHDRNRSVTA